MENDLFKLFSENKAPSIEHYVSVSMEHCHHIIKTLETLSENEDEKNHIVDILKECLYEQQELVSLQSQYLLENDTDRKFEIFKKIQGSVENVFNIEEELIADYPHLFSNNDGQWLEYQPDISSTISSNFNSTHVETKSPFKKYFNIKELAFGVFFLFPVFLLFIFYPWVNNKIKTDDELSIRPVKYEYDRAYRNIFYIYSAVLYSKNADDNFYTLIRNNSFKMPEGFVVIDKNVIVDYYLKEYYTIKNLDTEPDITIVSVNNLNFIQCKYIITKFSGILVREIILNEQPITLVSDFKFEDYCLSDSDKNNTVSIYIKKS